MLLPDLNEVSHNSVVFIVKLLFTNLLCFVLSSYRVCFYVVCRYSRCCFVSSCVCVSLYVSDYVIFFYEAPPHKLI